MPNDNLDPGVGGEEPLKPTHSLPRYSEPTPETHRKVTREEEAELALKRILIYTWFATTAHRAFPFHYLACAPAIQLAVELQLSRANRSFCLRALQGVSELDSNPFSSNPHRTLWQLLPRARRLESCREIDRKRFRRFRMVVAARSVSSDRNFPRRQRTGLSRLERTGSSIVRTSITSPVLHFLIRPGCAIALMSIEYNQTRSRPSSIFEVSSPQRGIDLIVIPVPTKAGMDAAKLSSRADQSVPLQNPSFLEFKTRLESAGIRVLDPGPALIQRKTALAGAPLYLETDTHWRPETMQFVSENLATWIPSSPTPNSTTLQIVDKEITGLGDIFKMLRLPSSQRIYGPEKISLQQVSSGNGAWRASNDADILLLGDSFSNIFSLEALGWGESSRVRGTSESRTWRATVGLYSPQQRWRVRHSRNASSRSESWT